MSKIIYGVFDSSTHAHEALESMGRGPTRGDTHSWIYEGAPSGEDLTLGATRVYSWAAAAMLLVGFLGAVLSVLVVAPMAGFEFGVSDFFAIWGLGTMFGFVAGAVSGMGEPVESLDAPFKAARAPGKAVVLIDSEASGEIALVKALREAGAEMAEAA